MQAGKMVRTGRNGDRDGMTLRVSPRSSLLDVHPDAKCCPPRETGGRKGSTGVEGAAHRGGTRSMKTRAQVPGSRDASHQI